MTGEEKEVTFHVDDRGVRITNTRLMVPNPKENTNTTYAMANISAVTTEKVRPNYTGAVLLIVFGLLFAAVGFTPPVTLTAFLGLLLLAAGVCWAISLKPTYNLAIFSAGAKATALTNKDKAYVEKLVQAIHEAIIHRG